MCQYAHKSLYSYVYDLPASLEYSTIEEFDAYDCKEVVDYHEKDSYCEHLGS